MTNLLDSFTSSLDDLRKKQQAKLAAPIDSFAALPPPPPPAPAPPALDLGNPTPVPAMKAAPDYAALGIAPPRQENGKTIVRGPFGDRVAQAPPGPIRGPQDLLTGLTGDPGPGMALFGNGADPAYEALTGHQLPNNFGGNVARTLTNPLTLTGVSSLKGAATLGLSVLGGQAAQEGAKALGANATEQTLANVVGSAAAPTGVRLATSGLKGAFGAATAGIRQEPGDTVLYRGLKNSQGLGGAGGVLRRNENGVLFTTTDQALADQYYGGPANHGMAEGRLAAGANIADLTKPDVLDDLLAKAGKRIPQNQPFNKYLFDKADLMDPATRRAIAEELATAHATNPGADTANFGQLHIMDDPSFVAAVKASGYHGATDGLNYALTRSSMFTAPPQMRGPVFSMVSKEQQAAARAASEQLARELGQTPGEVAPSTAAATAETFAARNRDINARAAAIGADPALLRAAAKQAGRSPADVLAELEAQAKNETPAAPPAPAGPRTGSRILGITQRPEGEVPPPPTRVRAPQSAIDSLPPPPGAPALNPNAGVVPSATDWFSTAAEREAAAHEDLFRQWDDQTLAARQAQVEAARRATEARSGAVKPPDELSAVLQAKLAADEKAALIARLDAAHAQRDPWAAPPRPVRDPGLAEAIAAERGPPAEEPFMPPSTPQLQQQADTAASLTPMAAAKLEGTPLPLRDRKLVASQETLPPVGGAVPSQAPAAAGGPPIRNGFLTGTPAGGGGGAFRGGNVEGAGLPEKLPPEANSVAKEAIGLAGAPGALMTAGDLGIMGRNLPLMGLANPAEAANALKSSAQMYVSSGAYAEKMAEYAADPLVKLGTDRYGLALRKIGAGISGDERAPGFQGLNNSRISRAIESLPHVAAGERSYAGGLNVMAAEMWKTYAPTMYDAMQQAGASPARVDEQLRSLADVINHGNLYGAQIGGQLAPGLNAFFSPRALSGRFQYLLDPILAKGSLNPVKVLTGPETPRELAARNLAAFISANTALDGFMRVAGQTTGAWSVEADPRSSDAGKIKVGNTRIDPWAGFGPIARLVARAATGETKTADGDYIPTTMRDELQHFLQNKQSPLVQQFYGIAGGKDTAGKAWTPASLANVVTPLFMQDVVDAYKHGSAGNALIAGPASFLGFGASTYEPSAYSKLRSTSKDVAGVDWAGLLRPEQQALIEQHPELKGAYDEWQAGRTGESARIENEKASALAAIADKASTDPAGYRAAAGDIVSRAAISREAGLASGAIKPFTGTESDASQALNGYYDAVGQARNKTTGQVDYDQQDALGADYLAKLDPGMQKRVMDALAFSSDPTYRQYLQDRQQVKPYLDAPDKAFQYAKDAASAAPADSPAKLLLNYDSRTAFESDVRGRVLSIIDGINQQQGPQISTNEADSFLQSLESDMGLTDMTDAYRAAVIAVHPDYVPALNHWYGLKQDLIDLAAQIKQGQPAGVR